MKPVEDTTADAQKRLEELKVGDLVSITYTRARAASIEKRR